MKIKKMTAHFGALDGRTLELSDGLNILYAPNESGKSTWCAFLRAMLYGVDTAQRTRAGQKPDKLKYRPWSGTPMSGTMEVTTPEGPVTISRWTEREDRPMQAFSATVTGTARPAGLTSDTAGEALTGVPREVFERSAFLRQAGLEITNDPELDRRIGAIVSSGDEDVSWLETDKTLHAWLRRRRSGKRGAIPELEAEIAETRATLETLRTQSREAAALDRERSALEAELAEAEREMERARAAQRKRALAELLAARTGAEEARAAARTAEDALRAAEDALEKTPFGAMGPEEAAVRSEKDRAAAAELKRLADKLPPVKLAYWPLAAAALAFLLALLTPWKTACAGVGCILLLLFVVMFTRLQGLQKTKADTLADRQRILDAYGVTEPPEISGLLDEYRGLWREKERAALRLEDAQTLLDRRIAARKQAEARSLEDLDFKSGDTEAAEAGRRVQALRRRIGELRERRAAAEGRARATGDPMVLESTLAEQEERLDRLREQEQALTLAIEAMAGADAELQQRFSPRLAKEAAALFSRLTDGRYDEVTLARDLTARTRRTGDAVGWETDYLSAGAKDQLYLALRLAVCELALPGDDPCPMVLDDALVNFDRERLARALELLRELAERRQILLFTCHEREYEYFSHDPAVRRVMLEQ